MRQRLSFETSAVQCDGDSWTGHHHEDREDRITVAVRGASVLAAVLDGMGGLPHARAAAVHAAEAMLRVWEGGAETPQDVLVAGNMALLSRFGENVVGVTAAVVMLEGFDLRGTWLGDARIAVLSAGGGLEELTKDHTRLAEHTAPRNPSFEDVRARPELARRVTRSLGEKSLIRDELPTVSCRVSGSVLLYTDGYWSEEGLVGRLSGDAPDPLSRPNDDATLVSLVLRTGIQQPAIAGDLIFISM